ncbi:MAG: cell wall metabolism sensor histidine kinase WalK [Oscillospiraceae bacterium]|nr:cell wall metabolism sensor histidine kinase WalK [Oscillospiraceae bacterium]
MFRSLHMKLMLIMTLMIISLMTVVGAFLVNSVSGFYLEQFYSQMQSVFQNDADFFHDLENAAEGEENGAEQIAQMLRTHTGDLGVDGLTRNYYVLDGTSGGFLAGSTEPDGATLELTYNLSAALSGEVGDESDVSLDYMDVAIPLTRGGQRYVVYIRDNKQTVQNLTGQLVTLILEALAFGIVISILLSFLLSKTLITPIERLTEGAEEVAAGDFSQKIEVDSRDEIGVLTATFNDMAHQLESTLQEVENERNKLDTLFLHMTDGVVAFSREGHIIQSNPAAEEKLGRALPIGGEVGYNALFGDIASIEEVLEPGSQGYLSASLEHGDRSLELLLAPFDKDHQAGVLVVIHDVTEQHRTEEMRKEFVANVSHELRTPLTNIHSYAETLVDSAGALPQDTEKGFLNVILSESERMAHIVQDLLTLSRFDSGRSELNLTEFSFADAIETMISANLLEAQRHGHTLTTLLEPGLPRITADRERITQVMMNVVSNAIKYTPDGGQIQVSAGMSGPHRVWLEVADNGIGIPSAADRERIFERFYRVDKARSRESGGTGLGLSIAKEIVDQHQGDIRIVEKETPGLTIRVELPVEGPRHGKA